MQSIWEGKSAVVTGAASGIGLALSRALLARGVSVWMADIDAALVTQCAQSLGPNAHAKGLDVRDAAAVKALVDEVAQGHGHIDFMFNNAGIGIAGEVHEIGLAHFDRIIDVNIRGVVNGTHAAYAHMVKQAGGHIVNTASLAGLVPTALLTPYAMTKHAIVGLSLSLRQEAALHGVGVTAICPAAVETPLLDAGAPADLPSAAWRPDVRGYLTELAGAPYSADQLAQDALAAVERNQGVAAMPARGKLVFWLYRLFPGLVAWVGGRAVKKALAGRS